MTRRHTSNDGLSVILSAAKNLAWNRADKILRCAQNDCVSPARERLRRHSQRRGYALILVMVFVVLFSAMLGVAWRRVVSALRVENVAEVRRQCDEGSIPVLAQAVKVLETQLRWNSGVVKFYDVTHPEGTTDPEISFWKSVGSKNYKITFSRTGAMDGTEWSVSVEIVTSMESSLLDSITP